jgi:hypothetical protein
MSIITNVPGALLTTPLPVRTPRFVDRGASPVQLAFRGSSVSNGQPAPRMSSTRKVEGGCNASINPSSPILANDVPTTNYGARSGVRTWRPPV